MKRKVLKDDKRAIFTAAAKAQQAATFAHDLQPQPRGKPEQDGSQSYPRASLNSSP